MKGFGFIFIFSSSHSTGVQKGISGVSWTWKAFLKGEVALHGRERTGSASLFMALGGM